LINVSGNCFLENQANHEGIKVLFTRTIPSTIIDSTFTLANGSFEIEIEQGVYDIKYSKSGYYGEVLISQGIYPNVTLPDIVLLIRTKYLLVPSVYETIQEAINDALDGDTVLIAPGNYPESITFLGKPIIVGSLFLTTNDTSYISQTVITGNVNNVGLVNFENQEENDSKLIGLWIGGQGSSGNIGVYCSYSSPTIDNCVISDLYGRGIYLEHSSAKVNSCTIKNSGGGVIIHGNSNTIDTATFLYCNIKNNYCIGNGAGVFSEQHPVRLHNCVIKNNHASGSRGAGLYFHYSDASVKYCDISSNYFTSSSPSSLGGGISSNMSNLIIDFCTIANNLEDYQSKGGAIYVINTSSSSHTTIRNSIICNNKGNKSVYFEQPSYNDVMEYSDFFNNYNGNFYNPPEWVGIDLITNHNGDSCDVFFNTQFDPLFVDPGDGNYSLLEPSPCIDAGNPNASLDPDCSIADMGAYPYFQNENYVYPDFSSNQQLGDVPLTVEFFDGSCGNIIEWFWDFENDGSPDSNEENPIWTFNEPGIYSVSLSISNGINDGTIVKENHISVIALYEDRSIWHVSTTGSDVIGNGSEEYPFMSINFAYDAAQNGDTILIHPGIYQENTISLSKSINLISYFNLTNDTSFISNTIIDGNNSNRVFNLSNGVKLISGLTIRNGFSPTGSGIYLGSCQNININHCIIQHNVNEISTSSNYQGGAIFLYNSQNIQISNCRITDNTIQIQNGDSDYSGGVACYSYNSSFDMDSCFVSNNTTNINSSSNSKCGGAIYFYNSSGSIKRSFFEENGVIASNVVYSCGGGVIYQRSSSPLIRGCNFINNYLEGDNTSGSVAYGHSSGLNIRNSIFQSNLGDYLLYSTSSPIGIQYCDFYNFSEPIMNSSYVGELATINFNGDSCDLFNNIILDPEYIDLANGDYNLQDDSPCIDAGDPNSTFDPDNTIVDIGLLSYFHPVVAGFIADTLIGEFPLLVNFTDTTVGNPITWEWDFNNDEVIDSYEQNPSWIYSDIGEYSVSLFVEDNQGYSNSILKENYIKVKDELVTEYSSDTNIALKNTYIYFTDLSTGEPNSWQWDFNNDGIVDKTQQNPSFYFSSPGTFSVWLRVSDEIGRVDTLIKENYITIVDYVGANFSADPLNAQVPVTISFIDQSTGNPDYWEWDFQNDGQVDSFEQNPEWTYQDGGNYSVKLFASNDYDSDYETKYNYLNLYEPVGPAILSILDVPYDEGQGVVVNWEKCLYDQSGTNSVENYQIWRLQNWADNPWEFMGQTPAIQINEYAFIAPTLNDSTNAGIPYYTFMVSAITEDGDIYNSIPDSGYSVDNIAPNAPKDFSGSFENGDFTLQWAQSDVLDFGHYAVYKKFEDLTKTDVPYAVLVDTIFIDNSIEEEVYFYTVSTFDINGNESTYAPPIEAPIQKLIEVPMGWSGLSSYIQPYNSQLEELFNHIENSLVILQHEGGVFWPDQEVNTLGEWNPEWGYSIKTNQATEMQFIGFSSQYKTLLLPSGWSIIPVMTICPIPTSELFSQVDESFIVAKEVAGWRIYWPEMSINTLETLEPGKAYFILMESEQEITFPDCE